MKKSVFKAFFATLLVSALPVMAEDFSVGAEVAKTMVERWATLNRGGFGVSATTVTGVSTFVDADGVALWHAVTLSDGGCVFASTDRRLEPVIAVASNCDGQLPATHPLQALLLTDIRARRKALGIGSGGAKLASVAPMATTLETNASAERAKTRWANLGVSGGGARLMAGPLPSAAATANGNPPLTFAYLPGFSTGNNSIPCLTHWNQGTSSFSLDVEENSAWPSLSLPLYNYYTPYHYVCGCVATAGSVVLQYFKAESGPVALTNECTVNGAPQELVTIGGSYDWNMLPANFGGTNAVSGVLSDAQRELLGRVAYDVGVSVGMGYDNNGTGSGAVTSKLAPSFIENFGFASAVPADADPENYEKIIYNQLRCDAPVIFSIRSDSGGHAVVAVGYGQDNAGGEYTRVFMGWGGSSDAWYQLPDISDYKLSEAVTMISRDGACVPFCGRVKVQAGDAKYLGVTGVSVEIPGVTNVLTGANGLFAFRLTPEQVEGALSDGAVTVKINGTTEVQVEVGDDFAEDPTQGPAAINVTLDSADGLVVCHESPSEAAAVARRSNRMLLMVSGCDGEERTEAVKAALADYAADAANEFASRFVFYFADLDTDGWFLQDRLPSIGAFSPEYFSVDSGWFGGRVAYAASTGEVSTVAAEVQAVLEQAKVFWTDVNLGVTLEVGVTEAVGDDFVCDPGLGSHTGGIITGMTFSATAPEVYTNFTKGVVYRCVGWQLRSELEKDEESEPDVGGGGIGIVIIGEDDEDDEDIIAEGEGNEAEFAVATNKVQYLVWQLEPMLYHVTATACLEGGAPYGSVVPDDVWVDVDSELTLVASAEADSTGVGYGFFQWSLANGKDLPDDEDGNSDYLSKPTVTFTITEPMMGLQAVFRDDSEVELCTIVVGSVPAEINAQGKGTISMQKPTSEADRYQLQPVATNYVDDAGFVWDCIGWTNGVNLVEGAAGDGLVVTCPSDLTQNASVDWVWKRRAPESFKIEWNDRLTNLGTAFATNLMTVADMEAMGLDADGLAALVEVPEGFKPTIVAEGDNAVLKLELDEELLTPDANTVLTIQSAGDGLLTINGQVYNYVKGFVYMLVASDSLTGPWEPVSSDEYVIGLPATQATQTATVGADPVEVEISVKGDQARRFYKIRVVDINPSSK